MNYFFIHSAQIEKENLDIGFELYSAGHIIWLIAILVFCFFFSRYYNGKKSYVRESISKKFAVAILLMEIVKDIVLYLGGADMIGYWPLHLCGLAIFGMIFDAFWPEQKLTSQLFCYAFLPGATCALLFCNWTEYPFLNYMSIHSFIFHGWIVCYTLMKISAREFIVSRKGIFKTTVFIAICAVPIYLFNKAFEQNYMFLNEASEGSPLVFLWDIFGTRFGEIGYIGSYAVLVIIVFNALYFVYKLLGKTEKGKKNGII